MCLYTTFDSKVVKLCLLFCDECNPDLYRFYCVSALPFHNLFKVLLKLKQLVLLVVLVYLYFPASRGL